MLHFDLSTAKLGTVENLNAQLNYQLGQAEQKWGMPYGGDDYTARLQALVEGIYAKTGTQVVVLIDEYDAPMLYVMFSFLNKHVFSQVRVARGRMDILVTTARTIYVMELKIDGSVDEALKQIDDKGYAIPWQADGRRVVRVGINFSTQERTIAEWKAVAD